MPMCAINPRPLASASSLCGSGAKATFSPYSGMSPHPPHSSPSSEELLFLHNRILTGLLVNSTNNIDTPAVTWGALWAGGSVTPANPAYTVGELSFQLKDSGAKGIVTIPPFLETVKAACKNVGIPEDRILIMGDQKVKNFTHWRDLVDPSTTIRWRKTKVNVEKDIAFLVYSSGTTGTPKGVMLSHRNICSNLLQLVSGESENLDWRTDKILAFLPFFHIYGLTCKFHFPIARQLSE